MYFCVILGNFNANFIDTKQKFRFHDRLPEKVI